MDKHGIIILYHAHHEIFPSKVGKGGIKIIDQWCFNACNIQDFRSSRTSANRFAQLQRLVLVIERLI